MNSSKVQGSTTTEANSSFLDVISKIIKRKEFSVFVALVLLCTVVSFLSPYFLGVQNIFNVLRQFSVIGILAVGEALIIITSGIDLSVGSVLGLMGVITALLAGLGLPPVLIFFLAIIIGGLVSSINGLLVTKVRINPFIVTLGMMSVAKGAALLITGGMPISINNKITVLGSGYIGVVPVPVIIMFIIAVIGHIFASRTLPGRNIYAVGNNERAAKLSGIRVDRIKIMTFMIMGALCALSSIIVSGQLNTAEPSAGAGYEMDVIAAVVIGGASLSGGEGSIVGVILGAAIMGVLRNSFVLLGVPSYWQVVAIGVVTVGAVAIDSLKNRKKDR